MMSAITYDRYGGPEVLHDSSLPIPPIEAGTLRIRIMAVGINPLDWKLVRGDFRLLRGRQWPRLAGCDFAGVVEALDPTVTGWRVGERAFGSLGGFLRGARGALATYASVSPREIARLPDGVGFELGAALPIAGGSALQCIELTEVAAGKEVLVIGASGGVGSFAVCLAAAWGARVTAVCRAEHAEYARTLGAAEVLARDRDDLFAPTRRFDAIIDAASAHSFSACARILAPAGHYITSVPGPAHFLAITRTRLFGRKRAHALMLKLSPEKLRVLADSAARGDFRGVAISARSLADTRAVFEQSHRGQNRGKLVIRVGAGHS